MDAIHPEAFGASSSQLLPPLDEYEGLLRALQVGRLELERHGELVTCLNRLAMVAESLPPLSGAWIRFFLGHFSLLLAWGRCGFGEPDAQVRLACDEQLELVVFLRRKALSQLAH